MPQLPPLEHMRKVLRIGMSKDDFFMACDDLMEDFQLKISSPALSESLVGIHVREGDTLLCFLTDEKLSYVEYKGDIFME